MALLAWWTDWRRVAEDFSHLRWGLWLAALGLYLGLQVVSSVRWRLLARPLGFRAPAGRYVAIYFVGMFFNLLLPTSVGGDVVRAWYLARHGEPTMAEGRGVAAFVSVLADRLSGLAVLLVIACVAAAVCPVPAWMAGTVWALAGGAVLGLTVLAAIGAWQPERANAQDHPGSKAFVERLRSLARSLARTPALYRRHPRPLVAATLLSVVVQAGNVLIVWLIGAALDAPVPASFYWVLVPLVSLLTLVPISVNGMGVREGAVVLLLGQVGVSSGTALSLAFLWFAVGAAASLGGVVFYVWGRFPRPGAGGLEVGGEHGPVGGDSDQGRAGQPSAAA